MSAAPKLEVIADPFAIIRALNRMRAAGFALSLENGWIAVEPLSRLTDAQRAYLRSYKLALVALLEDAEALHHALVDSGPAGLVWMEGTLGDWDDTGLLAAGEVLYGDGRMVNAHGRRYAIKHAPAVEIGPEYSVPVEAPEIASRAEEAA